MLPPYVLAAHESAMELVLPAVEEVLGGKYFLSDDFDVHYDVIEDANLGKKPFVGAPFVEPYVAVVDRSNGMVVGRMEFHPVGEVWVESRDVSFDGVEEGLVRRLKEIPHTELSDGHDVGFLYFSTVDDQQRGVTSFWQSRKSRPIIVQEKRTQGMAYFKEPNKLRVEDVSFELELVPHRLGRYIVQKRSDDVPSAYYELEIPEPVSLGHADLYYVEPLSQESLERLLCMELSVFGHKRELGNYDYDFDCVLKQEDICSAAQRMADLPYPSRGEIFSLLYELTKHKKSSLVTGVHLDDCISTIRLPYEKAAKHLGKEMNAETCHFIDEDPTINDFVERVESIARKMLLRKYRS